MALPPHISKIGLFTGQAFLLNGAIAYSRGHTNILMIAASIYLSTMAHWYNIKSTGIAKTIDMIVVIYGLIYVTLYESPKFGKQAHDAWTSVVLLVIIFYIFNSVIVYFQSNKIFIYDTCEKNWTGTYNYLSLSYIPEDAENREKTHFYTTLVHVFFLHILTNVVAIYNVVNF